MLGYDEPSRLDFVNSHVGLLPYENEIFSDFTKIASIWQIVQIGAVCPNRWVV